MGEVFGLRWVPATLAVAFGLLALAACLADTVGSAALHQSVPGGPAAAWLITAAVALPGTALGVLLAARRPGNPIGWLLLTLLLLTANPGTGGPGRREDPAESHIHRMGEPSNAASNTRRVQWLHRSQRRSRAALMTERNKQMPLFMDMHNVDGGVSAADVAGAHEADLATQGEYGVNYLRYWVDEEAGKIFCLVDAPDAEAANTVHRQAHGLVADEIYPVTEHS